MRSPDLLRGERPVYSGTYEAEEDDRRWPLWADFSGESLRRDRPITRGLVQGSQSERWRMHYRYGRPRLIVSPMDGREFQAGTGRSRSRDICSPAGSRGYLGHSRSIREWNDRSDGRQLVADGGI